MCWAIRWTKTFPGDVRGDLSLIDLALHRSIRGTFSTYVLNASA